MHKLPILSSVIFPLECLLDFNTPNFIKHIYLSKQYAVYMRKNAYLCPQSAMQYILPT